MSKIRGVIKDIWNGIKSLKPKLDPKGPPGSLTKNPPRTSDEIWSAYTQEVATDRERAQPNFCLLYTSP